MSNNKNTHKWLGKEETTQLDRAQNFCNELLNLIMSNIESDYEEAKKLEQKIFNLLKDENYPYWNIF